MKKLAVRFTDDAEQEVNVFLQDLDIPNLLELISSEDTTADTMKQRTALLLKNVVDMFSINLPQVTGTENELDLRKVSRDVNLSKLLRERAVFRFYRLLQVKNGGTPFYMHVINPDTDVPFAKQEEFVGWVCSHAHVSRGFIFQRIATIDRALSLGFSLDDVFKLVLSKPYAIQETLHEIGKWERGTGRLLSINPDVVMKIADHLTPGQNDDVQLVVDNAKDNPDQQEAQDKLTEAAKPIISGLLRQVASHERAKDALDFVKYDILEKPEINYRWNVELGALEVEYIVTTKDENGTNYISQVLSIPFIPDIKELPVEVRDDLVRRLPIKNRLELDN